MTGTKAIENTGHTGSLIPVKPNWVVGRNLMADSRIGRPYRELVQQPPVVDLKHRRHIRRTVAGGVVVARLAVYSIQAGWLNAIPDSYAAC